jgi:hypothetical protein
MQHEKRPSQLKTYTDRQTPLNSIVLGRPISLIHIYERHTMRKFLACFACSAITFMLGACSAGNASNISSTSSSGTQPVLAQTTYSVSSVTGTYSTVWANIGSQEKGNLNAFYSGVGTLQFNGSGSISGGSMSFYTEGPSVPSTVSPCVYSVTGTYTLQSTALGTATLNLSSSTAGCTTTATWQAAIAAADGGAVLKLARTDGAVASGSATKQ